MYSSKMEDYEKKLGKEEHAGTGETPPEASLPAPRPNGENKNQNKNKKQGREEREEGEGEEEKEEEKEEKEEEKEKEEEEEEEEGKGRGQARRERERGEGESNGQGYKNDLMDILQEAAANIQLMRAKVDELALELKKKSNQVQTSDTMEETMKKECEDLLQRTKVFTNVVLEKRQEESEAPSPCEKAVLDLEIPAELARKLEQRSLALGTSDRTDCDLLCLRLTLDADLPAFPELHALAQQLDQDDQTIQLLIAKQRPDSPYEEVEQIFREMDTYKDPMKALLREIHVRKTSSQEQQESNGSEFAVNTMTLEDFLAAGNENMDLLNMKAACTLMARDASLQRDLWQRIVAEIPSLFDAHSCLGNGTLVELLAWVGTEVSRLGAALHQGDRLPVLWLPQRVDLVVTEADLLRQQLERDDRPGTLRWRQARFLSALHRLLFVSCLLLPGTMAA